MKEDMLYGERFSDRGVFWLAAVAVITGAHVYIYLAVGVHLAGLFEAAWVVASASALAASYAASHMSYHRSSEWRMFLRVLLQRCGACWNVFVLIASALMLVSRSASVLWEASVEARFAFSCAASFLACAYGLVEGAIVRIVRIEIPTGKMPRNGRLRVLQLSDLHIGPFAYAFFVKKIVRAALRERPDLTVVTGDLVDGRVGDERGTFPFYAGFAETIRELSRKSRLGAWAIPGNHDYYEGFDNSAAFIRRAGMTMLRTRHVDLGRLVLAGADDLDHETAADAGLSRSEELMESLTPKEREKFVILLRHRPKIEASTVGRFDLQLSGHTHGGQFFPLPSSRHKIPGRPKGLLALGHGSSLYVSNGTGLVGPPMRFFAPAEIVVFDLVGK
jgi:predicted MPP superfamily phosphohydrolase